MRDFNVKTWASALALALLPGVADAVGLGRINMLSALGDPLNAEIELVSVSKEEASTLSARIAPPDAYRQANLQFNAALSGARITVERRAGGQQYLKVTSSRPVTEPFIDLLVELTSSSGRLMREYTVLVDPPSVGSPPPATAAAPPATAAPAARPVPAPEPPVTTAAPAVRRPAAPAPAAAPVAGAKEYGPIQKGDTLGKIAKSVMPEGVTLEQMLVGLYRSNPDAFIRKNLNLVRTGKILRIPDREEIAAIQPAEARKEYRVQVADWNAYRQGVADSAGSARAEGRGTVSGRIGTKVEDKAGREPKDVVRLSRGEPPGAGTGKPRSTAERIRALEEEVTSRQKALNEANERISQLEKTLQDQKKLLELKSPGMAAAQQQAAKGKPEAKPEAKPEPKAEAPVAAKPEAKPEVVAAAKPEAQKAEAPKPEAKPAPADAKTDAKAPDAKADAKADATADAKAADAKADAKVDAKADAAAPKPAEQPKPKPKVVTPPPPPPAPDMMDQVMEAVTDPLYLAAGGGVLVLGGLAFWMARRRRGSGEDEPAKAAPVLGRTTPVGAGTAAAAATAAAAPVAPAAPPPPPPASDDVDPLAEAEVYIAYGRDAQAEEILKEALAKNPDRQDAKVKLLEIYAARKDKNAFNRLAADLHKQTGGAGDTWLAVAAMGYALDPANPLYEAGQHAAAPPSAAPAPTSDLDFELGGDTTGSATDITLDSGAVSTAPVGHDTTAVLDAGELQKMAAAEEPAPLMPDFTLEIPAAGGDVPTKTDIALEEPVPTQDGHMIDFQIELPKTDVEQTQVMAAPPDPDAGLDFKLDIPDLNLGDAPAAAAGGEKDGHWYDVQSKFDLAKAYQEMGDKDGAKDILQEVIKEGDTEQQSQAKKLLETLA